eukprot:CAMPEP_0194386784 /NCGR_PEP_ID=MMETSP0174-20130528/88450_1 /TAXON_ID=216777 /ORGANISM="Proboscia alata, Strain PI-D3" /LENGTH=250 /DNA_ID=CAMNT_0039176329 /DNA_START=123 /DNA_END=875 /DNA_ORIENTATION=+
MRAWTCHGRTQREMVDKLQQAGIIKSQSIRDCMASVDRANYVVKPPNGPYNDSPQGIGYGATISAPHMHAHALEEIVTYLQASAKKSELSVLDVGCGSGYLTACLGRLLNGGDCESNRQQQTLRGKVYGIEYMKELVDFSIENTKIADIDLLSQGVVTYQVGDGWKGLPEKAPFTAIHVGAAADSFPQELMMQLDVGGVMVIPVGPDGGVQNLYKVERLRNGDQFQKEDFTFDNLLGVRYVPLVHLNQNT